MKKISMNLYYSAEDLVNTDKRNLIKDVFDRFCENDYADLFNAIDYIEDYNIYDLLDEFIGTASDEELKKYITVDETSIRYDDYETRECNRGTIAYLIDINFDIDRLVNDLTKEEKDIER